MISPLVTWTPPKELEQAFIFAKKRLKAKADGPYISVEIKGKDCCKDDEFFKAELPSSGILKFTGTISGSFGVHDAPVPGLSTPPLFFVYIPVIFGVLEISFGAGLFWSIDIRGEGSLTHLLDNCNNDECLLFGFGGGSTFSLDAKKMERLVF